MSVLLQERMNTRYITNSLEYMFRKVLEDVASVHGTLDVALCKFGPNCSYMMREFYGRINFINSANKELNDLLQNNMKAWSELQTLEEWREWNFSGIDTFNDVKDLCLSIPVGTKLKVPRLSKSSQIAACVFLIMTRPDLNIDTVNCSMDIYTFVRDAWVMKRQPHDKYIQFLQPEIRVVECVDGMIFTPETGSLDETLFVNTQQVLPYDFGSIPLIVPNDGVLPEWVEVLNKIAKVFKTAGKPKRSIMDKLQFGYQQ